MSDVKTDNEGPLAGSSRGTNQHAQGQQVQQSQGVVPVVGQSTDFVKKLFQMLEENQFGDVVKWSDDGDSFLICDTNEFTKQVLPCYFKHSNFSSFVRQLNKYDFHKVKISPEVKQRYQLENVWEFKHPDFNRFDQTSLENIKRKVPTKKESADTVSAANCVPVVSYRKLEDRVKFLEKQNNALNGQVSQLNANVAKLNQKYESLIPNLLLTKDINVSLTRAIDILAKSVTSMGIQLPPLNLPQLDIVNEPIQMMPMQVQIPMTSQYVQGQHSQQQLCQPANQQILPTQQQQQQQQQQKQQQQILPAQQLQLQQPQPQPQPQPQQQQQQQHQNQQQQPATTTPTSAAQQQTPSQLHQQQQLSQSHQVTQTKPPSQQMSPYISPPDKRKSIVEPIVSTQIDANSRLLNRPPNTPLHVLLVEDDDVCIQLCKKFLMKYGCTVIVVTDGLSAISAVEQVKFDLVLMDIVMPNLDGASATSIIRSFDKDTPIIAMTGNYQRNDLVTYLNHGMTDILAKPFTKDDLFMILEKHNINKKFNKIVESPVQASVHSAPVATSAQVISAPATHPVDNVSQEHSKQQQHEQRLQPPSQRQGQSPNEQPHPNSLPQQTQQTPQQQQQQQPAQQQQQSQTPTQQVIQQQPLQQQQQSQTPTQQVIQHHIKEESKNVGFSDAQIQVSSQPHDTPNTNIHMQSQRQHDDILTPTLLESTGLTPETNAVEDVDMSAMLGVNMNINVENEYPDIFKRRKLL